jgi:uncharacterized membrane protein HdeD (DUF308 family)
VNRHYAGVVPSSAGEVEKPRVVEYYVVSFVRAVILVTAGLVIAFTAGHSAQFGLIVFGVMALVLSVSLGIVSSTLATGSQARGLHLWQALVSLVVGALAVGLSGAGVVFLLWAVVLWSLLVGVAEVFAGWRLPVGASLRRDWLIQGVMTVILALVVLSQPADSVAVVGFLGAWAVILGMYLSIAGFSARWATTDTTREGHHQ